MSKVESKRAARKKGEIPLQFAGDMVAWAAWLYYVENETQEGTAQKLGVSRATVGNYLTEAKERGLVEISVAPDLLSGGSLSVKLRDRFGLQDAFVIPQTTSDGSDLRDRIAIAGAQALQQMLGEGETLGVAWGRTMLDVGRVLPKAAVKDVTVMQIAGSMLNDGGSSPEYCTAMIANAFDAISLNFNAPSIVSTKELRDQLLQEPSLQSYFERLNNCDIAVFGVGAFEEAKELGDLYIAQPYILEAYARKGAVGVLVGQFIDADGAVIDGPLSQRRIGMSMQVLQAVPRRVLVSAGAYKAPAIKAVLKAGLCTHLVVDTSTAAQLLSDT